MTLWWPSAAFVQLPRQLGGGEVHVKEGLESF